MSAILNSIIPRLIPVDKGDPILGLEIIDGPYAGVIYSYKKFVVRRERLENGMVPAKFETAIHHAPSGFRQDEGFDEFCSEVLISWLHYLSISNFSELLTAPTDDMVH